nr:AraC family transcriptional regulator [Filimonas lacunae]
MLHDINYSVVYPEAGLLPWVDSFWMLYNTTAESKEIVVLPDGRVDLFLSRGTNEPFDIMLMGLGSQPDITAIMPGRLMFAISFNLPAIEYVLHTSIADIVDAARELPAGFWDFTEADLGNFDAFCRKATQQIRKQVTLQTDSRKDQLFQLLYASKGDIGVQELADQVFWSSRQINRYFTDRFGISLKTYCNILRFRASFQQIAEGRLYPEQNFTDQAHFIKEIKRLSGVTPGELYKNPNDRFIQFSPLTRQ